MARNATRITPSASPAGTAAPPRSRRKPQLAWLRAGDVRLVISHQDAQDRRILKALDVLVKAKPAAAVAPPARRRKLAA